MSGVASQAPGRIAVRIGYGRSINFATLTLLLLSILGVGCSAGRIGSGSRAGAGSWTLYAGLIKTQGYVVGSPLSSSGLHRLASAGVAGDPSSFNWQHIGWNTPRVSGISVDPANPATMYLAGGNGILRTTDGGVSWKIVTGWEVTEVQDVAVDPTNPSEVYLASAYGVWRTRDGGDTWIESNKGIRRKYAQTIEVDANTPRRVFAGTELGLFVSEDGAETWRLAGIEGLEVLDIQQSVDEPDFWVATTEAGGIWLSGDDGTTWEQQDGSEALSFYSAAIDPFEDENVAATGWDTAVWVTQNGGESWQRIGDDLPTPRGYELIFDRNVRGRLWVATLEEGVYYTDDFGQSWVDAGLPGTMVFDMLFVRTTGGMGS